MDGIRIKKLEINGAGPIEHFSHSLAPLTLIYGLNESGKTTIVENLIHCLFPGGKGQRRANDLRGEAFLGQTSVTLETGAGDLVLRPGKGGLDQLLPDSFGALPPDLYRLLYVKGAESGLESRSSGVSRTMVKNLVSNQSTYSRIRESLPRVKDYTHLEEGRLVGDRRGAVKQLENAREKLQQLEGLSQRFHESLSRAELARLSRRQVALVQERDIQVQARRHAAFRLAQEREEVEHQRRELNPRRLAAMERDLQESERLSREEKKAGAKLKDRDTIQENLAWLHSARDRYQDLLRTRPSSLSRWLFVAGMGLVAAAGIAFFLRSILGGVFSVAALLSLLASFVAERITPAARADGNEMAVLVTEIRDGFEQRFGRKATSVADFDAVMDGLKESNILQQATEKELAQIERDLARHTASLESSLKVFFPEQDPAHPDKLLHSLQQKLQKLDTRFHNLEKKLARLDVAETEFLENDPGVAFDGARLTTLEQELEALREQREAAEHEFSATAREILVLTGAGTQHIPDCGELSQLLETTRQQLEDEVLDLLAHLHAALVVDKVLEDFIAEEDERVETWLADAGIGDTIRMLTGRYDRVIFQDEELVVGNERELFPLANLSSGAAEQVLLALRMGIAPQLTGKQQLFLLLDDAFQFSDYKRRALLARAVGDMVRANWQVVYFSMDDDMRKRMSELGRRLGKGQYEEIVLPSAK